MPRHNGKVSAEIDLDSIEDEVLEWVEDRFSPEDVFSGAALNVWAEENGFTKVDA